MVTVALAIVPAVAPAAGTLKADYQLEGNHSSSASCVGAPNLLDIGPGSNAFAMEYAGGTVNGVLTFPADNGLSLNTAGLIPQTRYTVIMLFRLENLSSPPTYRRLLAFDANPPVSDYGLYVHDPRRLDFYNGTDHEEPTPSVEAQRYLEVALTRDGAGQVTVYANGVPRISYDDSALGAGALLTNTIVFFKDNSDEESAGAVARIRIYDDALSPAEVLSPPACSQAQQQACAGKQATIAGTPGNDRLTGTRQRDVIAALGGNDTVSGLAGNDLICAGDGKDRLKGGAGRDTLRGEGGKDLLNGGPGKDNLTGGKGNDRLAGGTGKKDKCVGNQGRDTATGCEKGKI
jgi:Concanavalin A-like lectin/glucanases superfamily/RTX calcium-binding nonapeptide repeat (4 copies)